MCLETTPPTPPGGALPGGVDTVPPDPRTPLPYL